MPDNRSHILNVALNLFAERGYDAVGVQDIALAAGITKPTLYHYFGSKRGLVDAVIAEKSESLVQDVARASAYQGDIIKSITDVVRVFFDFAQAQPATYRLMLSMWFAPPASEYYPAISDLLFRLQASVEAMFLQASVQHGNMRGRQARYAVTLRGIIDTYVGLALRDAVRLDDEQLIYRVVHEFMYGIFS